MDRVGRPRPAVERRVAIDAPFYAISASGAFETPLLRGRIQKHATFNELDDTLIPLASQMGDTSLYLASKFKDACLSAYRISKAHAATDKVVNDILAPVIDYMRKSALAAAATRAANKTDPEKKKS
jgi:hypothetical protein